MFGRDWEPGEATIVALKEIKSIGRHGGIDAGGAKMKSFEFVADVRPASASAVFRTVLHEPVDERRWRRPSVGDVVAVRCDARRQRAKFDPSPGIAAPDTAGGGPASVSRMKDILATAKAGTTADQIATLGAKDATTASDDRLERLEKLADLRDRGVLTDQEFAAEKARLLGQG